MWSWSADSCKMDSRRAQRSDQEAAVYTMAIFSAVTYTGGHKGRERRSSATPLQWSEMSNQKLGTVDNTTSHYACWRQGQGCDLSDEWGKCLGCQRGVVPLVGGLVRPPHGGSSIWGPHLHKVITLGSLWLFACDISYNPASRLTSEDYQWVSKPRWGRDMSIPACEIRFWRTERMKSSEGPIFKKAVPASIVERKEHDKTPKTSWISAAFGPISGSLDFCPATVSRWEAGT